MAERNPAKKGTQKSATSGTGFTAEERAAMKERAQELKAEARRSPRVNQADAESAVLAKIAEMPEPDRTMGDLGAAIPWGEFAAQAPELAEFGARRLGAVPAYLATVGDSGVPRVHPVTPIIGEGRLFVFMEPTSPKGRDIVRRGGYALHCLVPDAKGTGGEFSVRGRGERMDSQQDRAVATRAASYTPHDRYVLFELRIAEARCNGYGDVPLPEPRSWHATA